MNTFEQYESEVRGYCRNFPAIFSSAKGAWMTDADGRRYLDFFCGAGVLNYGHNPDRIKQALLGYLMRDGITHTLDMYSEAKERFIDQFNEVILKPRGLHYKFQFPARPAPMRWKPRSSWRARSPAGNRWWVSPMPFTA